MLCERYEEGDESFSEDFTRELSSSITDDAICAEQAEVSVKIETENADSSEIYLVNAGPKPLKYSKPSIPTSYREAANLFSSRISDAKIDIIGLQGIAPGLDELRKSQITVVETFHPMYEDISEICRRMKDAFVHSDLPFESAVRDVATTAETTRRMLAERSDAMTQFASQIETQSKGIRHAARSASAALADVLAPYMESVEPLAEQLSSSISRVFEQLINDFPSFDWKEIGEAAAEWGKYGWVIHPTIPINVILNVPGSRVEADKIMRSQLTAEVIQRIRDELVLKVRRKKDFEEALWLFDQKHYKPCAMMLCSIIEGELFARAKKNGNNRRNTTEPIKRLEKLCPAVEPDACISVCMALSACKSYAHFFANGKDFKRDIEDDLNRNFLQHGMMYKRVTRTVCVKLLLLLDGVIEACATYL